MRRAASLSCVLSLLVVFACGGSESPLAADGTPAPVETPEEPTGPPPEALAGRSGPPPGEPDKGDEPRGPGVGEPGGPPFPGAVKKGPRREEGLVGRVLNAESQAEVAEATIALVGTDRTTTSDAGGIFVFDPPIASEAVVRVTADGCLPLLVAVRTGDPELKVIAEVMPKASELAAFKQEHGEKFDKKKGSVIVRIEAGDHVLAGAKATLAAPGAVAWVLGADDHQVEGDTIPLGAPDATVTYPNVAPGEHAVGVEPPAGWTCAGPSRALVEAGAFTLVHWSCSK